MYESILELVPEAFSLVAVALGTLGLSGVGVYLEELAFATLADGQTGLGVWLVWVGAVALYGAYQLATRELEPRLRAQRA